MSKEPAVKQHTDFELYLEGVKIPSFSSITIRENEGGFPSAVVSFPATSGIIRTLPATVVQVFGPDPKTGEQILIFEGEIVSASYQKGPNGKTISFQCSSLLAQWNDVTTIPKDSFVTPEWKKAAGQIGMDYENVTADTKTSAYQKTNKLFNEIGESVRGIISEEAQEKVKRVIRDYDFTSAGNFSDEITQVLEDETVKKGDVHTLVLFFLRQFEIEDLYYGMVANSFRISKSIAVWPNRGKIQKFKMATFLERLFEFTESLKGGFQDGAVSLMGAIQKLLSTIHYTVVSPSSYTGGFHFWDKQGIDFEKDSPVRAYYMPNLEQSPPAVFNTIFPHQVKSISYNRDMMGEPTRTIGEVETRFPGVQGGAIGAPGVNFFVTAPLLDITNKGIEENTIGLTPEEAYRGITLNRASFNRFFAEETEDLKDKAKEDGEDPRGTYRGLIEEPLNQLTIESHYQQKLSSRTLNLSVDWSPYRMTGVPGTLIDEKGSPSMTGVISSISTNISGNGGISCSITFRSVRVLHEKEDLDHPEAKNMINDYTVDPYIDSNNYLFDSNIYGFENIGYDLYNYLRWGTLSDKDQIKSYADEIYKESKKNIEDIFSKNLNRFDDASILTVLRDKDGEIKLEEYNFRASDEEAEFREEFGRSAKLTKSIYDAVETISNIYNSFEKGTEIAKWADNFSYRNIIRKKDYFNYLKIDTNKPIDRKQNYKDSINLLTTTENTIPLIKENERKIKERVDPSVISWKSSPLDILSIIITKPLSGDPEISSYPGNREIDGETDYHKGVDYKVGVGTTVMATGNGVATTHIFGSTGKMVKIQHHDRDGNPTSFYSRYMHLSEFLVGNGEEVSAGEPIALSGNSGRTTGIHFHYDVFDSPTGDKADGQFLNPLTLEPLQRGMEKESDAPKHLLPEDLTIDRGFFKIYNLTRRAHIKVGYSNYITESLKALQQGSSTIRQNLNISS